MQEHGLKQTMGGDDDIEEEGEYEKKIDLSKYLNSADYNLSDLFNKILLAYKNGQDISRELAKLKHERMALLRVALRAITSEETPNELGMSKSNIAYYTIMLVLDQKWYDVFSKLVTETYDAKTKHPVPILIAMNNAYEKKKGIVLEYMNEMILELDNEEVISLIAEMQNGGLASALKKPLVFIARDDIGSNKSNAIQALSMICDDKEVAEVYRRILISPFAEGKENVLNALIMCGKVDDELIKILKAILPNEKNAHVAALIERLLGGK